MRIKAFADSIGINTLFLVLTLLHGDVRLDTVRPVPRKNKPRRGASHTCVPTRSVGTRARMPVSISQSECVRTRSVGTAKKRGRDSLPQRWRQPLGFDTLTSLRFRADGQVAE